LHARKKKVVASCETTFSMLSTLEASEAVFPSVLEAVSAGKTLVDCATLTPERMAEMGAAVEAKV
jgi:3-hydroxyisobutyrate dehydrogenase-like beta-hydroxyacid dehydrogenase